MPPEADPSVSESTASTCPVIYAHIVWPYVNILSNTHRIPLQSDRGGCP